MTDFLSAHLGIGRHVNIDLGKVGETEFSATVRPLSGGDLAIAQDQLARVKMRTQGDTTIQEGDVHFSPYQEEVACRALVRWNLTGPLGPLPLGCDAEGNPTDETRRSWRQLPAWAQTTIFEAADALNKPPSEKEERKFRNGAGSPSAQSEPESAAPRPVENAFGDEILEGARLDS